MTYATGQLIQASDYMGFRGANDVLTAYPSDLAATNAVAALYGVGHGTRGYGQTALSIGSVTSGGIVSASDWNNLYAVLGVINTHTGSSLTIPSTVSAGNSITANDGTSGRPSLSTIISTLDTNRLSYSVGQMSLTTVLSSTRTTPWNTSVIHEFTATFSSNDAARYLFNSGGSIYVAGSRTGGTVKHLTTAISSMLSSMGTIKIGALTTSYTGTGGTTYPIGYYSMTSAYQTLFYTLGGTYGPSYSYGTISYKLEGKVENVVPGLTGANGSVVRIRATISTGLPSGDIVDGTLTSTVSQLATVGVLSVTTPTYATTISL